MDLTEFRVVRPPVYEDRGNLQLPDTLPDPRPSDSRDQIIEPVDATDVPEELGAPEMDPTVPHSKGDAPLLGRIYNVLNSVSEALRINNDRMDGERLLETFKLALQDNSVSGSEWRLGSVFARVCITSHLSNAMTSQTAAELQRAVELTRLALLGDLLKIEASIEDLAEEDIFSRLTRTTVTLPDGASAVVAKSSRVNLIREATVADMHVIRREWAAYVPGEVANVRNVMHGETFSQATTTFREQEATTTTETDRQESTQQEDSSKLATELSREVTNQLNVTVNGYVDASAQYKTPVATVNVAGGVSAGVSFQRGERFASKVAREAVSRAVRTVDTRTRESRTQRELTRNKDVTRYQLTNDGDSFNAVYRWVDRIDRYQVFRYPDRLQLEFQLPEPAEFYRKRSKQATDAVAAVDRPPETFDVTLDSITAENIVTLATDYRASNLPALPDEEIGLTQTLVLDVQKESLPSTGTEYNAPSLSKEIEIAIPTSYRAESATYSGHGYPMWGRWRIGSTTIAADKEGFRSGFATVAIGGQSKVSWVGGFKTDNGTLNYYTSYGSNPDKGSVEVLQFTDQPGNLDVRSVPLGRAMLLIGDDSPTDLQPDTVAEIAFSPSIALTLKAGVSVSGLAGCVVTFRVKCKRTDEALMAWRLSVYDALFAAWSQWKRDYSAAQMRKALTDGAGIDAGSSQRNELLIREELKRQVISWLLDEEQFSGRPALRTDMNDAKFHSIAFNQALATAPTIQFLEQAFEWGNLMFMFYPYYWASGTKWSDLSQLTANDPQFEQFLRAGSARVVVPARPAFTDAVKNWLVTGVPFVTGQLPAPNDKLFVSIDREIRDLTAPWEGGIAEDSWEARVSTTMLYLDTEAEFPIKNDLAVLPVDKNTMYVPKLLED